MLFSESSDAIGSCNKVVASVLYERKVLCDGDLAASELLSECACFIPTESDTHALFAMFLSDNKPLQDQPARLSKYRARYIPKLHMATSMDALEVKKILPKMFQASDQQGRIRHLRERILVTIPISSMI